MNKFSELSSAEKGLLWTATALSLLSVLMIVGPYIGTYIFTLGLDEESGQAFRGGAAFAMTFGLIMMAVAGFSWISSIIMLGINLIFNRRALITTIGITTVILDVIILAYFVYFLSAVFH